MVKYTLSNINTRYDCYSQFSKLYNALKDIKFDVIEIDLKVWFGANMSAVLGSILDNVSPTNQIKITSDNQEILEILEKNGFLANYGYEKRLDTNNTTIKYLKLPKAESRFFNLYVMNELLSRSVLPSMTDGLKKKIAESIYEIFVNAQMHSGTEYIYTCGQFYPKKHVIEFTIVDTGRGFKKVVNDRFNYNLDSVQAIKWALDAVLGTIVNMKFRTDDTNSYRLSSENCNTDEIF